MKENDNTSVFNGTAQEFYSFVLSALVNEASKDKKKIFLEYRLALNGFVADAYLPEGLSVFGDDYPRPCVVQVDQSFKQAKVRDILVKLFKANFKGTFFHVSQDDNPSLESSVLQTLPYGFKTIFLGKNFVNRLINENQNAYLSHLLGNTENVLKHNLEVIGNQLAQVFSTFSLSLKEGKTKEIKESDPEELSAMNEEEFKAYLDKDSGKSNCVLIIGNGASIPFGSDNWSGMINNLVDRLEPLHIEKREHVETALSNSPYALSSFVKATLIREEDFKKYIEAIRYCIYRKYNPIMHDQASLVDVIARAKEKYRDLPLLTYNYDTFVEKQYFHNTKKQLNYYFGNDKSIDKVELLGKENVIHLHGYISYEKKKSKGVILTDEDYFKAYLDKNSWTFRMQSQALT